MLCQPAAERVADRDHLWRLRVLVSSSVFLQSGAEFLAYHPRHHVILILVGWNEPRKPEEPAQIRQPVVQSIGAPEHDRQLGGARIPLPPPEVKSGFTGLLDQSGARKLFPWVPSVQR